MIKKNSIAARVEANTKFKAYDENGLKLSTSVNTKTGEIEIKNPPFFQFTKRNFPHIVQLTSSNPLAASIFMFMVNEMDGTNAIIISYETLGEIFVKSRRTLSRAIKVLVDGNYLRIAKSGNQNIYCINAAIVWTKSRQQIYHAKFNATVYLSENEQNKKILKERLTTIKPK